MMSRYRGRGFYDPLSEMNRLFDQMFGSVARRTGEEQRNQDAGWAPAIDVIREDEDLVIRAEPTSRTASWRSGSREWQPSRNPNASRSVEAIARTKAARAASRRLRGG